MKKKWNSRTQDLTGKRFTRLKVLKFVGREEVSGRALWKCKCDCGEILTVNGTRLLSENVKSCGCLKKENLPRLTHGDTDTPFWKMWKGLRDRCNYESHRSYKNYGGRGITYDKRWNDYLEFKKDMFHLYSSVKKKWKMGTVISIERIDVNGNYCKENCTFIPSSLQSKNTRLLKWCAATDPNGRVYFFKNQSDFAKRVSISRSSIYQCLKGNWKHSHGWKFNYLEVY